MAEKGNTPNLRIALVGKTGAGKSAVGNTILGKEDAFVSTFSKSSVTTVCKKASGTVDGTEVMVVDTPGLFDTKKEMSEVKKKVARSISVAAPGPHVILIVIKPNSFTKQEAEIAKVLQEMFGKQVGKYSMVLFTHGDDLKVEGVTIETVIGRSKALRDLITQSQGSYHVFNNRDKDNREQVTELLGKINRLVQMNGGKCFTPQ